MIRNAITAIARRAWLIVESATIAASALGTLAAEGARAARDFGRALREVEKIDWPKEETDGD